MNNMNFKDILAKIKGLPTKTKNIILLVIGLVIFLVAYTMGFQKIQEKTAVVKAEVDTQAAYVSELKGYYDNVQTYEKGIAQNKETVNTILAQLPAGINSEDFLMYIKLMNESIGGNLQSVNISDNSPLGEFSCMINNKNVSVQSMHAGATFHTYMTYEQVKRVLKYVYEETQQVTFINSVSLSYSSDTAYLDSNFNLSKYYITYDGSEYKPVPVPDVPLGVKDPFGTGSNN